MRELVAYNVGLTQSDLGTRGIYFLSTDSYVGGASITASPEVTISFYMKPHSLSDSGRIFTLADDVVIEKAAQDLRVRLTTATGSTTVVTFSSVIEDKEKAYAVVLDGTTAKLYKSGALVQSKSSTKPLTTTGNLVIGATSGASSFVGTISSVKIYSSAMNDLYIVSDAYFHESLERSSLIYYIPMTQTSPNIVPTGLGAGVTTTIHALTADDFLFWVDIQSITEEIQHKTLVVEMESGYEIRRSVWEHPLKKWTFKPYHKLYSSVKDILDFFNSKNGNTKAFFWRCPTDGYVYKVRFDDSSLKVEVSALVGYDVEITLKEVR